MGVKRKKVNEKMKGCSQLIRYISATTLWKCAGYDNMDSIFLQLNKIKVQKYWATLPEIKYFLVLFNLIT